MSAKYKYITNTGSISTDTSELLGDVKEEWRIALGSDLDTDASTPQGTLIQQETLARTTLMKNNAELGSVINPSYSYGIYLDAIGALLGISRGKDIPTIAKGCLAIGKKGVKIPAGSRIRTEAGDVFLISEAYDFGESESIRIDVHSERFGAIPLKKGDTFNILENIPNFNKVSTDETTTITIGTKSLDDSEFKYARNKQLYQQSIGSLGAIYAELSSISGVTSVKAIENNSGAVGTVHDINFTTPNGVWICVAGAAKKEDIAAALWRTHMGGQPFDFGGADQGIKVDAPNGTYIMDKYSELNYFVKFTTPILMDAYVNLIVQQGTSVATQDDIIDSIIKYSSGQLNGEEGFVIGASVSSFEIASAANIENPGLYIKDCVIAVKPKGKVPRYPQDFGKEWLAKPWEQAEIERGFITVRFI